MKLLEENGINTDDLPWAAILPACQALAGGKDINSVLEELRASISPDVTSPPPESSAAAEHEFTAPSAPNQVQTILASIGELSNNDSGRMGKLIMHLCNFGKLSCMTPKLPTASTIGKRANSSIQERFIREHLQDDEQADKSDQHKKKRAICCGSLVVKSGTADMMIVQAIGIKSGKSYKAARHFYEENEDAVRLWCNKLLVLAGADARKSTPNLACEFAIDHGPMIAVCASEAIEVTDSALPTNNFRLHPNELSMGLDLQSVNRAQDPDMCYYYSTILKCVCQNTKAW